MSTMIQRHTLDTLTDDTEPGGCPLEPVSTWAVDLVGYEEPTGEWAELLDHCRDLAKGLLDPQAGFLTSAEVEDERFDEDAMAIARLGGERVYEQEQGFAPLVLEPGLLRNGEPNADALMAAWLEAQSPSTSLTTPELPERRHWGDIDLGEQLEGVNPFDAEQRPVVQPDGLLSIASLLMKEGGISPSFGLDGVLVEDLEEDLGEQGAANYLAHLVEMQEHLLTARERESRHAFEHRRRHPVAVDWTADGRMFEIHLRITRREERRYPVVTRRWRERNLARKARLAARCDDGHRVPFDLFAHVERATMPVAAQPRPAELTRGRPCDVLAYIERYLDVQPWARKPAPPVPVAPARRRPSPMDLPSITDERWWGQHGHRILRQVADWHPTLEPGTDAWWDAAEDAYYVLKAGV